MRRKRQPETKVWRDPNITPAVSRQTEGQSQSEMENTTQRPLAPKKRNGARIIATSKGPTDPREIERERLLYRVLEAEGRPTISKAANDFFEAGFELPREQNVYLQLLEHRDEDRVVEAINQLSGILDEEPPLRRNMLESRLHRIAEYADESTTQQAAADLRRALTSK
jgi:hypothetical protein